MSSTNKTMAVVGCQGTGKTVLMTVLSQRYAKYLLPANNFTFLYVGEIWNGLHQGIWPASTRMGAKHELDFILKQGYWGSTPVHMTDCAGQDMRSTFVDEDFKNDAIGICKELRDSASIQVVVNLRDFIGEPDPNVRMRNESFLVGILRYVRRHNPFAKVACVFTEYDQYKDTIHRNYGNCDEYIKKELRYFHHAKEGSIIGDFFRGFRYSWQRDRGKGWSSFIVSWIVFLVFIVLGMIIGGCYAAGEGGVSVADCLVFCGIIGFVVSVIVGVIIGKFIAVYHNGIIGAIWSGFLVRHSSRVRVFPVAAVAETELDTKTNPPTRIPKVNFASEGLEELVHWMLGTPLHERCITVLKSVFKICAWPFKFCYRWMTRERQN